MTVAQELLPLTVGVYSPAEAARLVGKRSDWVRRLSKGYAFRGRDGRPSASPPLFKRQLGDIKGKTALSFLDLVELLFIRDFLEEGVSLYVIRRAAEVAAEMFSADHPFCVKQFQTDGKAIFARASNEVGDDQMVDLVKRQHVFSRVVSPFMKQLDYDAVSGDVRRWFPLGKRVPVVLDPSFSFGAPIIAETGVPTSVLFSAHKSGDSDQDIASWYEVSVSAVRAAIEFESQLAA